MCGIFAIVNDNTNQAGQTVLTGLKKLEYRGYDSWGVAAIPLKGQTIMVDKHIGKIGEANTNLSTSLMALGHTRWATHGGVTDDNAHPHLDCTKKIAVIHNGIVENYQELKAELIKNHHQFVSQTDTEIIAHLVEENIKKYDIKTAVFKTFKSLHGSNAIAVLDINSQSIVCCRDGSPLVLGYGNNQYFLASDVPAFLSYTNKVHYVNDGEGAMINQSGIVLYDLLTETEKPVNPQTLDFKLEDAEKGGYPHFLLKEIYDQKTTIEKTTHINEKEINEVVKLVNDGYQIILTGCGTAGYCALAAKYYLAAVGIDSQVYTANEFDLFSKFSHKKTLLIAISQSGETADTLIAVKKAKKHQAKIVSIINARGSTLERLSDVVIPVGAGPEIAVVSTKAFTSQLSTLYLLSKAIVDQY